MIFAVMVLRGFGVVDGEWVCRCSLLTDDGGAFVGANGHGSINQDRLVE
jgi:hypothetical protein